jgi:hypothetical protein
MAVRVGVRTRIGGPAARAATAQPQGLGGAPTVLASVPYAGASVSPSVPGRFTRGHFGLCISVAGLIGLAWLRHSLPG